MSTEAEENGAMNAVYDLLRLVESGHFYEDHDQSVDVLYAAQRGADAVKDALRSYRVRLDEAVLRYIEASNPGIDIEQVRRDREARKI